jgi:hypothetical protein
VLLYLPHLGITLTQLAVGGIGHGQDGWLPPPDKFVLFSLIKTLFGTGYVWIAFVLLLLIAVIIKRTRSDKKIIYLLALFLFNYAIIHFYSVAKAPIFQYSVMLFSAPCFIWAFAGYVDLTFNKCYLLVASFCLFLILQSVWKKDFFNNAVLNQNDEQSIKYVELEDKYGKGTVEALYGAAQPYFVVHYEVKYKRPFKYHLKVNDVAAFKSSLANSTAKFFIAGDPSFTEFELIKEKFPFLVERTAALNVNTYVLSKEPVRSQIGLQDEIINKSDIKAAGNYTYNFNKEKYTDVYRIDSLDEYPFSAKAELKNVAQKEGQVILAKVKLKSDFPLTDVGFNYSITNKKDSTLFFGGPDVRVYFSKESDGYWAYSEIFLGSDFKYWMKEESNITFFLWNRGKHKFSLSDCRIETYDYWPKRWSWWD